MKFTVNKQALYSSLQRMIPVVPAKTTIPVLTNILFELNKNSLRLTGTGSRSRSRTPSERARNSASVRCEGICTRLSTKSK